MQPSRNQHNLNGDKDMKIVVSVGLGVALVAVGMVGAALPASAAKWQSFRGSNGPVLMQVGPANNTSQNCFGDCATSAVRGRTVTERRVYTNARTFSNNSGGSITGTAEQWGRGPQYGTAPLYGSGPMYGDTTRTVDTVYSGTVFPVYSPSYGWMF